MIGKLDDYLRFQQTALSVRSTRQQLIASNIANADTPNFKARDIDFASTLQNTLANTAPPAGVLTTTNAAHFSGNSNNPDALPDGTPLQYRTPAQGAADGNTVDMDVERNQFADNAIRYEASLTMIGMQIKNMMAAIQGGS